jgi:histidinol-phosphate aminotransferase
MPWMTAEVEKLGLKVTPSVGNFILIHFPEGREGGAAAADEFLKSKGIIMRRVAGYGLPNALRMTIGTAEENRATAAALAEFTRKTRA